MSEASPYPHELLSVDGVVVHHFAEPGDTCEASLIFAVGVRDETLPTLGVLHLIEHLVVGANRATPIEINGSVDMNTTTFMASGSPARVGAWVSAVCASLRELPTSRLAVEAEVVEAEGSTVCSFVVANLMAARFGHQGPGVAFSEGPGPDAISATTLRAVCERWFVAENAVLVVTGTLPDGLDLRLSTGTPPSRGVGRPARRPGPWCLLDEAPHVGLALTTPGGDPRQLPAVAFEVLYRRVEEQVRHLSGHSYTVDQDTIPMTDGSVERIVYAEAPEPRAVKLTTAFLTAVADLFDEGPSAEEVRAAIDLMAEREIGRRGFVEEVVLADVSARLGFAVPGVDRGSRALITAAEVHEHLRAVGPSGLYYAHHEAESEVLRAGLRIGDGLVQLAALPPGRRFRPRGLVRLLNADARAATVVLTGQGLALAAVDGVSEIRWNDVVGVMRFREGSDMVVFGRDGSAFLIGKDAYRGGDVLVDELLAHVAGHLVFTQSAAAAAAG